VSRILGLALLALAASCASGPEELYLWGSYEECVWGTCSGEAAAAEEIRLLAEDVERARSEGQKDPPGLHAHLGYLYLVTGNPESAASEFRTEKELWPESAVFMDRLLEKLEP
jgi:hypothetical protein